MHTPPTHRKHRLSVPIAQDVLKVYSDLAKVSGKSLGAVIADWLQDTASTAQITVKQLEAIRRSPEAAMERFEASMERAEYLAEQALEFASDKYEDDGDTVYKHSISSTSNNGHQAVSGSVLACDAPGPDTAKRGLTPPSSNTGGKVGKGKNPVRVPK